MKSICKLVFLATNNNQLVNIIAKVRYNNNKTIEYLETNLKK